MSLVLFPILQMRQLRSGEVKQPIKAIQYKVVLPGHKPRQGDFFGLSSPETQGSLALSAHNWKAED